MAQRSISGTCNYPLRDIGRKVCSLIFFKMNLRINCVCVCTLQEKAILLIRSLPFERVVLPRNKRIQVCRWHFV